MSVWYNLCFYPFPTKHWFLHICGTSLLKTLWEKEKNTRNEQFLLFPQSFLCVSGTFYTPHNKVEGGILESPWPSVCPWTQFCPELFSYSVARTALKFIHNVCVHMKLCICNFHDHTIIGCGIIFP